MACPLLGLDRVLSWTGSEFKFLIGYLGRSCAQPDLEPRWAAVLGFCFWLADHHRGHSHHGISAVSSLFHSPFSLLLTTYPVHQATHNSLPSNPSPQPAPSSLNRCPSVFFTCLLSIFTSPPVFCHLPLSCTICSDDDSDADDGGSDSAGGNGKGEKTSSSGCYCICLVNAYCVLGTVRNNLCAPCHLTRNKPIP